MKMTRRMTAAALAAAVPVTALSAGIASAASAQDALTGAAGTGTAITLNFGADAADKGVTLKVNDADKESGTTDSNGSVTFNYKASGTETLKAVVDGEEITLSDAKCTSEGTSANTPGGGDSSTPVGDENTTPGGDTTKPGGLLGGLLDKLTNGGGLGNILSMGKDMLKKVFDSITGLIGGGGASGPLGGILNTLKGLLGGILGGGDKGGTPENGGNTENGGDKEGTDPSSTEKPAPEGDTNPKSASAKSASANVDLKSDPLVKKGLEEAKALGLDEDDTVDISGIDNEDFIPDTLFTDEYGNEHAINQSQLDHAFKNKDKVAEEARKDGNVNLANAIEKGFDTESQTTIKGPIGAALGGLGGLAGLLGGLAGGAAALPQLISTAVSILGPMIQTAIPVIQGLIQKMGGIDGILKAVSGLFPVVGVFKDVIKSALGALGLGGIGDGLLGGGDSSTGGDTGAGSDMGTGTNVSDQGEAPALDAKASGNTLEFTISDGVASVNCDVTSTAGDKDKDSDDADNNSTMAGNNDSKPVSSNQSGKVSTPGPKVNTGGEVENASFFSKVAASL